ncbi:allantoinase AllB [soil metagenome]
MAAPMDHVDLLLSSRRVVTPEGLRAAAVAVDGGRIVGVFDDSAPSLPHARLLEELGDLVLMPGLVDSHVHVNEPGRTHWEGFDTATTAAALGGVTTIVDMPLNSLPPTTDVAALKAKQAAAAPKAVVDVAFWGGAVPGNEDQLEALHDAGVRGFKAFLCDSGVPEYGCVHPTDVQPLLARIAALGSMLIVHAEDPDVCDAAAAAVDADRARDPRAYTTWLDRRPAAAEVAAVEALVRGCRETGARVHVLHLSAAEAGAVIADAKAEGLPITVETCPHYLVLAAEDVPDGAMEFKCAPPIRSRANADALWDLLADGVIDMVVSDHSPCPPEDKATGEFTTAWGGIASLQLGLPLIWTAARRRGHDLADVARWMSAAPEALAGLEAKGRIAVGADADLVVLDPDARWTVDAAALAHRHPVTPYHGRQVTGRVVQTWLGGRLIVRDGATCAAPVGRLLP